MGINIYLDNEWQNGETFYNAKQTEYLSFIWLPGFDYLVMDDYTTNLAFFITEGNHELLLDKYFLSLYKQIFLDQQKAFALINPTTNLDFYGDQIDYETTQPLATNVKLPAYFITDIIDKATLLPIKKVLNFNQIEQVSLAQVTISFYLQTSELPINSTLFIPLNDSLPDYANQGQHITYNKKLSENIVVNDVYYGTLNEGESLTLSIRNLDTITIDLNSYLLINISTTKHKIPNVKRYSFETIKLPPPLIETHTFLLRGKVYNLFDYAIPQYSTGAYLNFILTSITWFAVVNGVEILLNDFLTAINTQNILGYSTEFNFSFIGEFGHNTIYLQMIDPVFPSLATPCPIPTIDNYFINTDNPNEIKINYSQTYLDGLQSIGTTTQLSKIILTKQV